MCEAWRTRTMFCGFPSEAKALASSVVAMVMAVIVALKP